MGYDPVVHDEAKNLEGYRGKARQQKAHIVIPRAQVGVASNDVGFERVGGKYKLHASQFDSKWRTEGEKLKTLNKIYGENKVKSFVNSTGGCNILNRKVNKKGQIEIHLRAML